MSIEEIKLAIVVKCGQIDLVVDKLVEGKLKGSGEGLFGEKNRSELSLTI